MFVTSSCVIGSREQELRCVRPGTCGIDSNHTVILIVVLLFGIRETMTHIAQLAQDTSHWPKAYSEGNSVQQYRPSLLSLHLHKAFQQASRDLRDMTQEI